MRITGATKKSVWKKKGLNAQEDKGLVRLGVRRKPACHERNKGETHITHEKWVGSNLETCREAQIYVRGYVRGDQLAWCATCTSS
jgi:hypothetical protein